MPLAQGVDYMHKLGMAHGDLHPANIFLGIPDQQDWTVDQTSAVCGPPKILPTIPVVESHVSGSTPDGNDHVPKLL
ncbi:hypothetical protein FGG08_007393 [Glutinoglossum americanum]|uniref:Protein kinase domain-containing protein n=1 Tax=Glutinoglossum americanum TaxID=1670608 RepID=A0A9P8L038_9PEZI|nr:hypothetical protein FGG08_007393 [Glutinoglossum americanum]